MRKIILGQNQCQITEEYNVELIRALDDELSFFVQGAQYSRAYKGYTDKHGKTVAWDGRKRLLTKSLKFPAGLIDRVKKFYNNNEIKYEIVDNRPALTTPQAVDIIPKLKELGKNPYPYQLDAANKAIQKDRGIIRVATGGGKSLCAALITANLGKTTFIYVIGTDLLHQFHNLFSSIFNQPIGIIGDGECEIHDINIATVWTVGAALGLRDYTKAEDEETEKKLPPENYRKIRDALGKTKVHIIDECHLSAASTVQGIYKKINPENIYGMSASPWRDDGADLLIEAVLGGIIVDIPAKWLIENNYLVEPIIKYLSVPKMRGVGSKYPSIYKNYIIENNVRNEMIAKGAKKLTEQGYQTLVLFHTIKHGDILYDLISKDMPCALLSGKDDSKTREKVKKQLENHEINCVLASKIFDIGVDLPSLSGLVIGGGGKSSIRALQRVGRVIRKYPGKTNAAVIDFIDNAKYLIEHSETRNHICSQEFNTIWLKRKKN